MHNVLLRTVSGITLTGALLFGGGAQHALAQNAEPVLAPGTPPLTRTISDSSAELTMFMLQVVATGDARPDKLNLDAGVLDGWADSLASSYTDLAPAEQQQLAMIPAVRNTLESAWPQATRSDKADVRAAWRPIVESWLAGMDCETFTGLADAGLVEHTLFNVERYQNCEDDDSSVASAQSSDAAFDAQSAGADDATAASPRASGDDTPEVASAPGRPAAPGSTSAYENAVATLNARHNMYVSISNSMLESHVATMNAIQNIGDTGYHYEITKP